MSFLVATATSSAAVEKHSFMIRTATHQAGKHTEERLDQVFRVQRLLLIPALQRLGKPCAQKKWVGG